MVGDLLNIKTGKVFSGQPDYPQKEFYSYFISDIFPSIWNGEKFPGGFGSIKDYESTCYWSLRKKSNQLFHENAYARGMIRCLVRNEIHKGLNLEANTVTEFTALTDEQAIVWDENAELTWNLWACDPWLCDWKHQKTFGEIQDDARFNAIISGDILVVNHVNQSTGLPIIELIDGEHVKTPFPVPKLRAGNRIVHGVELDQYDRHIAFWVEFKKLDGTIDFKRITAYGEKSKRKIAWLIYGSDKRMDEVRGEPLLALVFYMLKELDRYRDAELRATVINAILAMFIKKTQPGIGSHPIGTGAVKREQVEIVNGDITASGVSNRKYNFSSSLPGNVVDELNIGEEPVPYNPQRPNAGFKVFEETIINTIAWSLEIPPEIARLLFQNNFSASRQANNEFNVYLSRFFWKFGNQFCQPIYDEFIIACVLTDQIQAPGFLDAYWSNNWKVLNSWLIAEWSGISRPSVDVQKDANAAETLLKLRITTYDQQSRRNSGMPFRVIIKKLAREKALLEKVGLTSSVDENNNGEPIPQ